MLEVPAAVFCSMIMLCFGEGVGSMERSGAPWGCQTQSALRKGLLDLIQHIPKQRLLITFSVNGHCLTRLGKRNQQSSSQYLKIYCF